VQHIVLVVLAALPALALAAPGTSTPVARPGARLPQAAITRLSCSVQGTPSEFPDGVTVENKGNTTLKSGTKLAYSFENHPQTGEIVLTADLAPGQKVHKEPAVPGGLAAGTECRVKVK
jgi:hypothetical protein